MLAYNISHEFCDGDALPAESTSITSLVRDRFYKVCPGSHRSADDGNYATLGQPRCGDGTNYSFMVSRPPENPQQQREKILIELMGGGACWDAVTCAIQKDMLTFPTWLSAVIGKGCSDSAFSDYLLCSKTVGGVDFSEYTTVMIPYCTQDVHLGDEQNVDYGVKHVGAHNLQRTLQWVFENFPDPSHIFITGCSAGGTPLPVVYDMINSHYKSALDRSDYEELHIDVIVDSAVFLTPSHFLENYLPNWNLDTIMNSIGFDYDSHKMLESYPDSVMDYALKRSKKTDQYGFASHDDDQISQYYYTLMNGEPLFGRDRLLYTPESGKLGAVNVKRRTSNNDEQSQWWSQMNSSMKGAMNEHKNSHPFVMEGSGHCFGSLSIALQYAGFEEWASSNVLENGVDIPVSDLPGPPNSGSVTFANSSVTQSTSNTDLLRPPLNISVPSTDPSDGITNVAAHHTSSSFIVAAMFMLSFRLQLLK
mmetsp:Transcript_12731/g.31076  ORF Transcript_12731/g.31076 Transcript_12731/m.31076 type:complete len:478 (+) Transcript_12731:137-1570(+)|eukprot:CAMPEP_0181107838 /NCGR_PEP_ID=MMETSP1071-20121207/17300_1 /TAXON_ID=35127 /ORGANISM="Thalassiosira sp., Strain NH16" /LENGTH=477 /DNA_ID=CAMNT_0023191381 /DNA_START=117 /DNA_END=1550 /DNA_ORIENTATION=+